MNISLIDTITFLSFAIYTIVLVGLLAVLAATRRRLRNSAIDSIKANADVMILADELDRVLLESSDEANESFIKFLSESREWAYEYIEDTQGAISNYRIALDGQDPAVVIEARNRLFDLLPESSDTKD